MNTLEDSFSLFFWQMSMLSSFSEDIENSIKTQFNKYELEKEQRMRELLDMKQRMDIAQVITRIDLPTPDLAGITHSYLMFKEEQKRIYLLTDYPNTFRYSLLVSCITQLESILILVHDALKDKWFPNMSYEDQKNNKRKKSKIQRIISSINKEIDLSQVTKTMFWGNAVLYNSIRNTVVHESGSISAGKLYERIKEDKLRKTHFVYIGSSKVILTEEFTQKVIQDCRSFIRILEDILMNHKLLSEKANILI